MGLSGKDRLYVAYLVFMGIIMIAMVGYTDFLWIRYWGESDYIEMPYSGNLIIYHLAIIWYIFGTRKEIKRIRKGE